MLRNTFWGEGLGGRRWRVISIFKTNIPVKVLNVEGQSLIPSSTNPRLLSAFIFIKDKERLFTIAESIYAPWSSKATSREIA